MAKGGTFIPDRVCLSYSVLQLLEGGDLTKLKTNWWYDRSECGKGELQVQFSNLQEGLSDIARHFSSTVAQNLAALCDVSQHKTCLD